jgi:hypothetical protein
MFNVIDIPFEIERITAAFDAAGVPVRFVYGSFPDVTDLAEVTDADPFYYIGNFQVTPEAKIVRDTCGDQLVAARARYAVIAETPGVACASLVNWIKLVYRTPGGNLGKQSDLPVELEGVGFYEFAPLGGVVPMEALPMQVGNGTLWRAEVLVDAVWQPLDARFFLTSAGEFFELAGGELLTVA